MPLAKRERVGQNAPMGCSASAIFKRRSADWRDTNTGEIFMAAYELTVTVRTQYLAEQSEPDRSNYAFAYAITITNTGQIAAQVISRHWVITDANNHIEEVRGLGVIGHQPLLEPGQVFEYTSGATLTTPQGSMRGAYFCVAEDGEQFQANIPEFVLSLPRTLH